MKRITNDNYESVVYISHPYGGLRDNEIETADIINRLRARYPNHLFVSPIHAFSYAYLETNYQVGIEWCLWLLEHCDEMWVFGDYKSSKGCMIEIDYCNARNIECKIMDDEDNE